MRKISVLCFELLSAGGFLWFWQDEFPLKERKLSRSKRPQEVDEWFLSVSLITPFLCFTVFSHYTCFIRSSVELLVWSWIYDWKRIIELPLWCWWKHNLKLHWASFFCHCASDFSAVHSYLCNSMAFLFPLNPQFPLPTKFKETNSRNIAPSTKQTLL